MIKARRLMIFCIMFCVIVFVNVTPVHSQSVQYGKLTGKVLLASGEAVTGVTVVITSDALVTGKRSTISSATGTYVFLNLPVGKYNVSAQLTGFKTIIQKNISVSVGGVTTVNLLLESGEIQEEVVVTATPPIVDVKTSSIDTKLNNELLKQLPTSRDAFYDLSLTTPGMFDAGAEGSWLPSPTAYGGATNENIFLVNGVNTTNPRGASWGSLVRVNYNAVEEVRIVSLGSKAEYGSFSGAAIDVVTKSGSNKLKGTLSFYSMLGDTPDNQPADTTDFGKDWLWVNAGDKLTTFTKKDLELNFTMGGPLIKNKIWFFLGFAYVNTDTKVPIFEPLKGWKSNIYDLRLTAEPSLKFKAWVSFHHENNENLNESWSLTWDPTMVYNVKKANDTISTQMQWNISDLSIFSAKYLGFWTNDKPNIPSDGPDYPGYINWWKWNAVGVNGAFPYVEAQKSSRHTLQADVSHYAENFLGEHDLKFGVQYTRGRGNWMGGYFHGYANFAYPYRWTQNINYMQDWYGDTGLIMYNRQEHLNPFLTVRTSDSLGLFFDDQWTIGKRLTVNVGLRYDRMSTKYGVGKVYEFASTPDAINDPPPVIRDRESTDNIFDFKTFSPRIGFSYMLTNDGKTVLRANYGRYYMPISVENLRRFGPDMPDVNRHMMFYSVPWDIVDVNGNNYVDPSEVILATRALHGITPFNDYWETVDYSWALKVADDVTDQYTDQFTISLERELAKDLSIEASYIYKNTGNLLATWPINRATQQEYAYDRVPYTTTYGKTVSLYGLILQDFNGDGVVDGGDITWVTNNTDYEVRNIPEIDGVKAHRAYHGFQLVLNKRYSDRWQMMASLLYSATDGLAPRSKRQDFFIEGPMIMDDLWIASLNQLVNNMEGPLPFTPKFEFKLSGSFNIPVVDAILGFRFRYNSGRPLWPLSEVPTRSPWADPPGSVVTTGGGWVVGIDNKDPYYLPGPKILDLSVSKSFKLGNVGRLTLNLDFLNVFNDATAIAADWSWELGRIMGFTLPRKVRLGVMFDF
jgi:hypothetical protein